MTQELLRLNMEFSTAVHELEEVGSKIQNAVNHGEPIDVQAEMNTLTRLRGEAKTIHVKLTEELDK